MIKEVKTQESLLVESQNYKITIHTNKTIDGYSDIGGGRVMGQFGQQEMWLQLKLIESSELHLVSVAPELNLEKLFIDSIKAS